MILQTLSEGWDLMRVDQHLTQSWPNSEIQFPGSAWWTCFGPEGNQGVCLLGAFNNLKNIIIYYNDNVYVHITIHMHVEYYLNTYTIYNTIQFLI